MKTHYADIAFAKMQDIHLDFNWEALQCQTNIGDVR